MLQRGGALSELSHRGEAPQRTSGTDTRMPYLQCWYDAAAAVDN